MGYTSAFFVFLVFGSRRVVFPLLLIKHRASKIQWPRREDRRYKNGRQVLLLRLLRAWFKRRRFEVTVRTVRGRVKTLSQIIGYFIITKSNLIKWSVAITPTTAMQCGCWNSTLSRFRV